MIEKLMIDSFEKSQILEQNETPYLECCRIYSSLYSGKRSFSGQTGGKITLLLLEYGEKKE